MSKLDDLHEKILSSGKTAHERRSEDAPPRKGDFVRKDAVRLFKLASQQRVS
jgi:hypothetical protein